MEFRWTGVGGVIEQCGIYANGVLPKGLKVNDQYLDRPNAITGAHGILIKNVKGTSNGLLITGCEIQGNADVQVMVEVGANIRIVQNDFKADDQSRLYTFPAIDIQVGDGNLGDAKTDYSNILDDEIYLRDISMDKTINLLPAEGDKYKIIELVGKPSSLVTFDLPVYA